MRQRKLLISRTTSKLETSIWCGKIQMKMNLRRLNKTSDGMRKKQGKMCKLMMKGKRSMPPSQNTLNSWSKTMKVWKRIRLSRWWRTTMSSLRSSGKSNYRMPQVRSTFAKFKTIPQQEMKEMRLSCIRTQIFKGLCQWKRSSRRVH